MSNEETDFIVILINLRRQLIDARESMNRDQLDSMFATFDELLQASYQTRNDRLIELLVNLKDSTRDALNEESWKSTLPSVEDVKDALS